MSPKTAQKVAEKTEVAKVAWPVEIGRADRFPVVSTSGVFDKVDDKVSDKVAVQNPNRTRPVGQREKRGFRSIKWTTK